jgi:hypothetical protein
MKLKIKVTKEILEKTKLCKTGYTAFSNCAIAVAVRDLFPKAFVSESYIFPLPKGSEGAAYTDGSYAIALPQISKDFIRKFDMSNPSKRVLMDEIEFEISVHDYIIEEAVDITEITKLLENHPTLEIVSA